MNIGEARQTRFTREELYELVWTEPLQSLAPRFGISDVALKKRCLRMRIPTPGRGFWAKKAAGVTMRRPALPKLPASVPASATTAIFTEPPKPRLAEEEVATGPVADQARYEAMEEHRIVVPELLEDPHPLVSASIHLLRKSRTDAEHVLVPSGKSVDLPARVKRPDIEFSQKFSHVGALKRTLAPPPREAVRVGHHDIVRKG